MKVRKREGYIFLFGLSGILSLFLFVKAAESQVESSMNLQVSQYSSKYALVIGIENYKTKEWGTVVKAVYDAGLVGNALEKLGFKVTYRYDIDSRELEDNLRSFFYDKTIDNGSCLFLWYSGHGHTIDGEGFLVPADAPSKDDPGFKMKAFPVRRFDEYSRLTTAKHVYMIFDSCFACTVFNNESSSSSDIPIASMSRYSVRQYIYSNACTSNQVILRDRDLPKIFIKALLNEANADANSDNYLTAGELSKFIKKMIDDYGNKQSPKFGKLRDFDKGEFFFQLSSKSTVYFSDTLKDGGKGPKLIQIQRGVFKMGDILGSGFKDEKSVHKVTISDFSVSRCEITFDDYDRYCEALNPKNDLQKRPIKPSDEGWGRGNRPVINVSWEDAVAYTKWLSDQSGYTYRLPTEAEWEYFARAGTETDYWWGNEIGQGNAACYGCGAQWGGDAEEKKTAPVGSFDPNSFDIFDTVGNVWEWTCSEYIGEYNDSIKETKCLGKITTGKEQFVIRGGSWDDEPKKCRASHRKVGYPGERSKFIGFRVVRELK